MHATILSNSASDVFPPQVFRTMCADSAMMSTCAATVLSLLLTKQGDGPVLDAQMPLLVAFTTTSNSHSATTKNNWHCQMPTAVANRCAKHAACPQFLEGPHTCQLSWHKYKLQAEMLVASTVWHTSVLVNVECATQGSV
jgi:hypothetical protein